MCLIMSISSFFFSPSVYSCYDCVKNLVVRGKKIDEDN